MSETVPEFGGCLWPVDPGCFNDEWQAMDADVQERGLAFASVTLERLTAYRVGECPITVRPNLSTGTCFVPTVGGPGFSPGMNTAGQWVNGCGVHPTGISGGIRLPAPVGRIDEVKVDGAILDPADYGLVENYLVWRGAGTSPFPISQDVTLADTEPGTMSITYLNAYPVDLLGARAAAILAMEFAKACTGASKCRLPSGVRSVVKQGVSYDIQPGLFPDGHTGIKEVDAFIDTWNPHNRTMQTRIFNPDVMNYRVT